MATRTTKTGNVEIRRGFSRLENATTWTVVRGGVDGSTWFTLRAAKADAAGTVKPYPYTMTADDRLVRA